MEEIFQYYKKIVSSSLVPTVLEFGTCEGDHTKIMVTFLKSLDRKFIYHAFEPNTSLEPSFIARNGDSINSGLIKFFKKAIGKEDGLFNFYVSSGAKISESGEMLTSYHGSSSIKTPKLILEEYPEMKFENTKTEVVSLNTHYKNSELNGNIIDFIWADVQGAEKDMINGGLEIFKTKVRYLYTEYIDGYSYSDKINIPEILELLPNFEVIKDFGGDVLLKNKNLN